MSEYDLVIRNGRIVTVDRQLEGDIAVKDGRIVAVEPGIKGKGTRVAYEPTPDARAEMVSTVTSVWNGVDSSCTSGEFEARKSRLCDWCSFKSICPAWEKK